MSLPPGDVTAFSPILIPIGDIKMVAEAGFEPAGMTLLLRKPALPICYSAIMLILVNHSLPTNYSVAVSLP